MERTSREACNISPRRIDDTARRRRLYRRQDQHACRLAYDEQIRLAVCQIGESRPIPQSRFGRVDQQKRINRQGGIIRPTFFLSSTEISFEQINKLFIDQTRKNLALKKNLTSSLFLIFSF